MDEIAGWYDLGLEEDLWSRDLKTESSSGSSGGFQFQGNSTSAFINEFEFAAAKSIRTSVVILASFNAIAAFATAATIYWDCYMTKRKGDAAFRLRTSFWKLVGPAETFPFTLSCGIMIQGIIFAVAESNGLKALLVLGCTPISQSMLPGTLIVPYIQLIFGVETTVRASWRQPFPKRPRWMTAACLAILGAVLLATYLTTRLYRAPNFCFASLFWFVQRWKLACAGVLIATISTSLITTVVIIFRLRYNARVDAMERVAASWMAYFMGFSVIINFFIVPFFYSISFSDLSHAGGGPLQLSLVASVVANLSGFITGGLYLFLRSSRFATIKPQGYFEHDRQQLKKGIRIWAPSNYTYPNQMAQPVSPPTQFREAMSRQDEVKQEEERTESPSSTPTREQTNPLGLNAFQFAVQTPRKPDSAQVSAATATNTHNRNDSSISLTKENKSDSKAFGLLPAATYAPELVDELMVPPPLLLPPPPTMYDPGHRRDSSVASSATVQIGLRLSNVNEMPPLRPSYTQDPSQARALGVPDYKGTHGSRKLSPLATNAVSVQDAGAQRDLSSKNDSKSDGEEIRLSPTVYSPEKQAPQPKATTPIGIGFSTPASDPRPVMLNQRQGGKEDWI